ncbi:hypothetical protein BH10BDE1_BH10BDE1_11640 [soil metagenome]
MLIYEALQRDHLKLKALTTELLVVGEKKELRRAKLIIEEIRDELIPHSRAEEAVFYNVLATSETTEPLILHRGFQEHFEAESALRALLAKSSVDLEWMLLAKKFQKLTEDHIQEEETEIFEFAKKMISDTEAEMMTTAFEQLKPKVQKEGWVKDALDLASKLMPPRYAATLRTFALKSDSILRSNQ